MSPKGSLSSLCFTSPRPMIISLRFDTKYPLLRDEVFSNCFVSLRNLVYLVRRLRRSPLKGLASLDEAILKESLGLLHWVEWGISFSKWGVGVVSPRRSSPTGGPTIYVGGGASFSNVRGRSR
jgi:hypothetical protein